MEQGYNPNKNNQRSYNGTAMQVGQKAENIVMSWLKNNPSIIGVDDLTHLRQ